MWSKADYYNNRKKEVLTELYRKDGNAMLDKNQYKTATEFYSMALRTDSTDIKALVNRSKCHLKLLHIRKATDDVDNALHLDNLDRDALLQKAEVLFKTQNYESAFVYFNRGMKHYPRNNAFIEGAKRTEHFLKGKRSKSKRMKLSAAGDLTHLSHKVESSETAGRRKIGVVVAVVEGLGHMQTVPPPKPFVFENKNKVQTKYLPKPSASFRDRTTCQLVRIHRAVPVGLNKATTVPALTPRSVESLQYEEKRPESSVLKTTLKELYTDKKYLQKLTTSFQFPEHFWKPSENEALQFLNILTYISYEDFPSTLEHYPVGGTGSPIQDIAEEGLNFLYDRYTYWNRLGPLPPPHAPRKSRNKLSGSSLSIDSTGTLRSIDSKSTWKSTNSEMTWKSKGTVKSKLGLGMLDKRKTKKDPAKIEFNFTSHTQSLDLGSRRMSEIVEENEEEVKNETNNGQSKEESRTLSDYMDGQLQDIDTAYKQQKYSEVYNKCDQSLRLLERYHEMNEPRKPEFVAELNSYIGNVAIQAGNLTLAHKHHNIDLKMGEKYDLKKARHRALGNLGMTYMLQKKYNRALEMYTMKAPLCKTASESSMLFHDIGNCFLMLTNYSYARDAGRKSLETAEEAEDRTLQLQASILIGLTEVHMKKLKEAHQSFEAALAHAQSLGDANAEQAMEQALIDVNKKLAKPKRIQAPPPHHTDTAPSVLVEG